jgi:histidinol-phosphate aminotransferase
MNRYWSPIVGRLTPYVPGEQPKIDDLVKLNTNESPYPPAPGVIEAVRREAGAALRLYPDPEAHALKSAIAQLHGVEPRCVFVGNGSDEVLGHAFQALLSHGAPVLFPDITYSFYPVYCSLYGIEARKIPLREDFTIDPADYHGPSGGIVIANPNAPTGRLLGLDAIEQVLHANRHCVVLVDEAYIDYGGRSAVELVSRFDNLLVVQTFSKSRALAGLRVGFAIGHHALIEALERVKGSFNSYPVDRVAMAAAVAAIEDREHFAQTCGAVVASRERLSTSLTAMGFEVLPSAANFVFARHPAHEGLALYTALRERRILVRHFGKPRIDRFIRITVGTDPQCDALLAALREILAG